MHPHQEDNLLVLHGTRYVEIYTPAHGRVESFVVTPHRVEHDGRLLYDGPATGEYRVIREGHLDQPQ
jgi:hypothetical protein